MPFPLLAAAAPAIGAIGASVLGGMFGSKGQSSANAASQRSQDIAWERDLYASNTAYQRAVADMKSAGLNPMLAYQQGGSSSPSSGAVTFGNEQAAMAQAMINIAGTLANSALVNAQKDKTIAETQNVPLAGDVMVSSAKLADAQRARIGQELDLLGEQISQAKIGVSSAQLDNERKEIENRVAKLNEAEKAGLLDAVIRKGRAEGLIAENAVALSNNLNELQESKAGKIMTWIQAIRGVAPTINIGK